MALRDTMQRDAAILTRLSDHGELVTWRPKGGGAGSEYEVQATVDRVGVVPDDDGETTFRAAVLAVRNGGPLGLRARPTPGDGVDLAMQEGGPVVTAKFRSIVAQDPGMFLVEVSA